MKTSTKILLAASSQSLLAYVHAMGAAFLRDAHQAANVAATLQGAAFVMTGAALLFLFVGAMVRSEGK